MIGKKGNLIYYRIKYRDADGIQREKYHSDPSWRTAKEAKAHAAAFLLSVQKMPGVLTMDELHTKYAKDNENKIKMRSLTTQAKLYKLHIKPYLGNCIVDKIDARDIARWQSYIVSRKFANTYSKAIQTYVRTLINYGLKHELIRKDNFKQDLVRNTMEQKKSFDYWTVDEFKRFIDYVDDPTYELAFSVLYWCGLRKGELMALQVRDYNDGVITVNKTYDFTNKLTTSPKTITSIRTVQVIPSVAKRIDELIESYRSVPGYTDDHLLFGYDRHITAATLQRKMASACVQSGVKLIRVHDIRHSHVSLLISMGFSGFEIAKRMGHTVEMVNNIYGHWFVESQQLMIAKLEEKNKMGEFRGNPKN